MSTDVDKLRVYYHILSESFHIYCPIDEQTYQHAVAMADDKQYVTAAQIQSLYDEHISSELRSLRAGERAYIRRLIENFIDGV